MKKWNTPEIDVLNIAETAQGTVDPCPDMYDKGSFNGPGSTPTTQGICS